MEAIELYLESGRFFLAQSFFKNKGRLAEWAALLESRGRAGEAAVSYEAIGDYGAAIRCYEKDGSYFVEVGDLYFKLKDYSKALEAYLKAPVPDLKKIGRTHERRDDWSEALRTYRELGDWRGCKRCETKIAKREAKRQTRTLPFPKI
jgi:tetratricopeptide (TPR) repeat protein